MKTQLGPHVRVLFLASNPVANKPLDLEGEAAAIQDELEKAGVAHALPVYVHTAATTDDLHEALMHAPYAQVLHLAGHGSAEHGFFGVDPDGHPVPLDGSDLAQVLATFPNIRLVVLSACHQLEHADEIAKIVPCAIGTSDALSDDAARRFSRALYKGLANNESVGDAFERAKRFTRLDLQNKADVLRLCTRPLIDARWIKLIPAPVQEEPEVIQTAKEAFAEVVTGFEDVVITANVLAPWQDCIPHVPGAQPKIVKLNVGEGGWHRTYPPEGTRWAAALEEIRRGVKEVNSSKRQRVHVLVKLPYSLSAYLGRELEQQNRDLLFYQESPEVGGAPDHRVWQAWGPGLPNARPPQQRGAAFPLTRLPRTPVNRSIDVGVLVSASRAIDPALAEKAINAVDGQVQLISVVPADGTHASALNQSTIDQAAAELSALLQKIPESFPQARALHLFFAGPQVLLMRAVGRLNNQPHPVYLYEWFSRTTSGAQYVRTLELVEPRLDLGAQLFLTL